MVDDRPKIYLMEPSIHVSHVRQPSAALEEIIHGVSISFKAVKIRNDPHVSHVRQPAGGARIGYIR